jgi:hypothetical protein
MDVFDIENNIIILMTKELYIEYSKKLRKEYREKKESNIGIKQNNATFFY